jgi:UDP-N-acetylmuramoyl-tripeptide--D-alanyl-D-alanine ligase
MDNGVENLYLLVFGIWFLASVREILGLSYFWQLKEYRVDRMSDFLKTSKGLALILSWNNLVRLALVVVLFLSIGDVTGWGVIGLGLFTLLMIGYGLQTKKLYRPKRTFRMMMIVGLAYAAEIGAFLYFDNFVWALLFLEIVRPFVITAIVLLVGIPFKLAKKHVIKKATKKIKSLKNLKVIGITGSYGKTSTKEFLYDILKKEFKVVKTPKNINVDIGVARTILSSVNEDTEIFIVEMGAYKKQEIDDTCAIVSPTIGILTGINEQHLSLFGSIENTIKAKGELLASLPKNGVAIVNWDNENCHKAAKLSNADEIVKYGVEGERDVKATGVEQDGALLKFNVHIGEESEKFEVGVLGKHYVQNLLGTIYCAYKLGLGLKEISQYVKTCRVVEQSLELFDGKDDIRILDDSYNSNPDGFIAALKTAKALESKRVILVTMGMLELGKKSDALHRKVGKEIKKVCDKVFVTSQDAFRVFSEDIEDVQIVEDHKKLIKRLDKEIKKGDLILFENRVQKAVLDHFKK